MADIVGTRLTVGDKVRVRSDLEVGKYYGGSRFCGEMFLYSGETHKIRNISFKINV